MAEKMMTVKNVIFDMDGVLMIPSRFGRRRKSKHWRAMAFKLQSQIARNIREVYVLTNLRKFGLICLALMSITNY